MSQIRMKFAYNEYIYDLLLFHPKYMTFSNINCNGLLPLKLVIK